MRLISQLRPKAVSYTHLKSTVTALAASYLHNVKGYNVAVVDCDDPQHSIHGPVYYTHLDVYKRQVSMLKLLDKFH